MYPIFRKPRSGRLLTTSEHPSQNNHIASQRSVATSADDEGVEYRSGYTATYCPPPLNPVATFYCSHNDEAKPTPLVGALAAGLQSIEVDCYLLPDTQGQRQLVIGHDWDSLDPSRLLGPAYLQPLAQRIAAQGGRLYPGGALTGSGAAILLLDSKLSSQRKRGVNASEEEMYEAIEALLWSFHNAYTGPGQLFSRHSQGHTWPGALLAVLSGDRPAPQFVLGRHKQRGVAGRQGQEMEEGGTWLLTLDGRLTDLGIELETPFGAPNAGNQWNPAQPRKMMLGDKLPSHLTAVLHPRSQPGSGAAGVPVSVMPLVSQGLYGDPDSALPDCADPTQLLPAHKARLRYLAEAAHAQGRLLRVWDHPDAPDVWGTLLGLGLDLVNVEDCAAFQAWAYQQLGLQPVAQSQLGARTLQTQGRVLDMASDEELSDDEDVEYMLGFVDPNADPSKLRRHRFPSKVGGRPAWLNPLKLPTKEQLTCKSTGKQLLFLLQLYAPLDDDHPNQTTAFHRAVFLFVTPKGSAVCKPGGVRALRCQLPRRNALYPYHAPGDTDLLPPAVQAPDLANSLSADPWQSLAHDGTPNSSSCSSQPAQNMPQGLAPAPEASAHPPASERSDLAGSGDADEQIGGTDKRCERVPGAAPSGGVAAVTAPPPALFPELELVVEAEERDSPEAEAAMSKLLMAYKDKVGQEGELSEEELPEEVLQQVEEAVPLEQRHFAMFQARMALAPDQVVRYCFQPGAHPLWPRPEPQPSTADIPACPLCGEPRQFEFQVLPQLLNHLGQDDLDEDALDWGTLAVYSCSASCSTEALQAQTGSAYAEEFVWAQPSA
ncbi:hypothetical protein QJQ45_015769 [Haematococcus lacustris]|nr:hypothetical protein QJQ45_015769 [Haematococcus lacustris]